MSKVLAKGAAWMVGFRLADRSLGLISTVVLARLLVPEDFGLIAMAMSVIAAIDVIGSFGFDSALIAHRQPERRHYDSAFTLNVLLALVCAVAVLAAAYPAAALFGERRLIGVMSVLAFAWLVQGFANIRTVDFRRDLEFHREFAFLASKRVIAVTVTVAAAFAYRNYWALVIGTVAGNLAMVVLSYVYRPYRPRFTVVAWRELMSFSVWLFATNALGFVLTRLSNFVIGGLQGPRTLGLYTIAYEIGTLPTSELIMPINRAMFPGFARLVGDPARLRAGVLDVIGATGLLVIPAAFGIAAIAEPLVIVFLSRKWLDVVPLLQILAFMGAVAALTSSTTPAYMALGRARITTLFAAGRVALLVPLMIWAGSAHGATGVAWAELVTGIVFLPFTLFVLLRNLALRWREFLAQIWRPIPAAIAMHEAVRWAIARLRDAGAAEPLVLASALAFGVLAYVAGIGVLCLATSARGVEYRVVSFVRERLMRSSA